MTDAKGKLLGDLQDAAMVLTRDGYDHFAECVVKARALLEQQDLALEATARLAEAAARGQVKVRPLVWTHINNETGEYHLGKAGPHQRIIWPEADGSFRYGVVFFFTLESAVDAVQAQYDDFIRSVLEHT